MDTSASDLPDATELLRQMQEGDKTAETIMQEHLARLHETQPHYNGATQMMIDSALEQARAPRPGPLSGLPLSVKETFNIAGEQVTLGSKRRRPTLAASNAVVVDKLQNAGAIVIARSNVPELAMAGETENLVYGRTNNAINPKRVAGGSSGGEAVLVATGASAIGIGSDILGSIRIPAAFNGIVGFKPASASVDKNGTWPQLGDAYLSSWLGIGPLVRSVRDARLVYNAISQQTLSQAKPINQLRLVIPDPFFLKIVDPAIERSLKRAETALSDAGMKVGREPFPDVPSLFKRLQKMVVHDLEKPLRAELSAPDTQAFSVWRESIARLLGRPTLYSGLFQLLLLAPLLRPSASAVPGMIAAINAARDKYRGVLGHDGILMLPTLGQLAPPHGRMNLDSLRPGVNGKVTPVTFANMMDMPAITLPCRADRDAASGLVPAVMLLCAPGAEGSLLDVAAVLEEKIQKAES
jgi:aspartyl-tRNA(Asn)/glutamyl-tRNA(Gln) amidotransferase subunit A/fatty acid amide hydrolase 2